VCGWNLEALVGVRRTRKSQNLMRAACIQNVLLEKEAVVRQADKCLSESSDSDSVVTVRCFVGWWVICKSCICIEEEVYLDHQRRF